MHSLKSHETRPHTESGGPHFCLQPACVSPFRAVCVADSFIGCGQMASSLGASARQHRAQPGPEDASMCGRKMSNIAPLSATPLSMEIQSTAPRVCFPQLHSGQISLCVQHALACWFIMFGASALIIRLLSLCRQVSLHPPPFPLPLRHPIANLHLTFQSRSDSQYVLQSCEEVQNYGDVSSRGRSKGALADRSIPWQARPITKCKADTFSVCYCRHPRRTLVQ